MAKGMRASVGAICAATLAAVTFGGTSNAFASDGTFWGNHETASCGAAGTVYGQHQYTRSGGTLKMKAFAYSASYPVVEVYSVDYDKIGSYANAPLRQQWNSPVSYPGTYSGTQTYSAPALGQHGDYSLLSGQLFVVRSGVTYTCSRLEDFQSNG